LAWLAGFSVAMAIGPCAAADSGARWPQFRGPDASGTDVSKPLPIAWDLATGANVRWNIEVPGLAHASPIAWGDRVFVTTATKPGESELRVGLYGDIKSVAEKVPHQWRLMAFELRTGKPIWSTAPFEAVPRIQRHPKATHCNSTPAIDRTHIVAMFGSEGLFCFDTVGRLRWRRDFGKLDAGYHEVPGAQWGFASSPVLRDGRVYVLADVQKDSFVAALDADDGHTLWRAERRDVPTWGSPVLVESDGGLQVVVNGWHHSGAYDAATGRELWRLDGGGNIPVPTPIHAHGLVYLTSAHGNARPMRAIRTSARGDITPADIGGTNEAIVWAHPRQGCYLQTPFVVGTNLRGMHRQRRVDVFRRRHGKDPLRRTLGEWRAGLRGVAGVRRTAPLFRERERGGPRRGSVGAVPRGGHEPPRRNLSGVARDRGREPAVPDPRPSGRDRESTRLIRPFSFRRRPVRRSSARGRGSTAKGRGPSAPWGAHLAWRCAIRSDAGPAGAVGKNAA